MAMKRWLGSFVLVLGCRKDAAAVPPAASVAVAVPVSPPDAGAVAEKPPEPAASGPLVVKGYPHNLANGMNEFAHVAGFSADSSELVWCYETGAIGGTRCTILARDGSKRTMSSDEGETGADGKPLPKELEKRKAIDKMLADAKIPFLPKTSYGGREGPVALGNPLTGRWNYPDITLDVVRIEASGEGKPAHVKVGGAVAGEKPVHPISLVVKGMPSLPPHFAALNALQLSPDGAELGFLMNTFACEYCIDFEAKRIPVGAFASLVYNDTGYRHHQKKEWREAAALFEKAAAADSTAKLPAYNLACAWARLADPRTKDALARAIKIDPSVLARAQTDEDFGSVKSEVWFPKP